LKCDSEWLKRQDNFSYEKETKDVKRYLVITQATDLVKHRKDGIADKKRYPVLAREVILGQGLKSSSMGREYFSCEMIARDLWGS